ncbi:COX15/CtaA family protein [Natribaculum luteum]|uniref:COX15/CtaA family protein n=1 Tax=Natribaculum luteum TaxID=1586232 RepID=A0ABD5NXL7_9EURY|nr:COX15/CtaA family protein [Natribaculum luteum]
MSYDSHTPDSSARPSIDRFGFPHLLATTVVMVAATILLGVAAKATGSGLACNANWPLCDGGLLNLFPATFPSFFEWIHRVVAGTAGFFIVGTAVAAWRGGAASAWIKYALTLGLLLTPVQVLLGRETVLSYELTILSLHFWTAMTIFVLFVASAVAVWSSRLTATHVTAALGLGAATVPVHVVLSPLFIGTYTPVIQTAQYAATLVLLSAVAVAAIVGPRRFDGRRVTGLLTVTPVIAFLVLLFGRRAVMAFQAELDLVYVLTAVVLFGTMLVGAYLTRKAPGQSPDVVAS